GGPQLLAAGRAVGIDAELAADDDLVMAADAHGDRRAPSDLFLARRLPDLLAGAPVEGRDERAGVLVLEDDDALTVQQRRTGGAVPRLDGTEALVPDLLAGEIDAEEALAA